MASLDDDQGFVDVLQLEDTHRVKGGPTGDSNIQPGQLASRDRWLFDALQQLQHNYSDVDLSIATDLHDVAALDMDGVREALIVTSGGVVRYTTDGFAFVNRNTGVAQDDLRAIACASADNTRAARFMVAGQHSGTGNRVVKKTTNRGTGWTSVTPSGIALVTRIEYVTAQVWVFLDNGGSLWRTANDGTAWAQPASWTVGHTTNDLGVSAARVIVVGATGGAPEVRESTDNCATWAAVVVMIAGATVINSVATDGTRWVVACDNGLFYAEDSGAGLGAFTACTIQGDGDSASVLATRVRFDASGRWIGLGPNGVVYSSLDGITWRRRVVLGATCETAVWMNGFWLLTKPVGRVARGLG